MSPAEPRLRLGIAPGKAVVGAVLVSVAAVLVAFLHVFQSIEALLAAQLYSGGTPTSADYGRAIVFFGLSRPGGFGLRITPECCSALLIVPIALVAAGLLTRPRVRWQRVLLGFAIASVLLMASNQLRIGVIAWASHRFGFGAGFEWSHAVLGSLISLVFAVGALAVLVRVSLHESPGGAAPPG